MHRTQNALKQTGVMRAGSEYDTVTCMRELWCEKLKDS